MCRTDMGVNIGPEQRFSNTIDEIVLRRYTEAAVNEANNARQGIPSQIIGHNARQGSSSDRNSLDPEHYRSDELEGSDDFEPEPEFDYEYQDSFDDWD